MKKSSITRRPSLIFMRPPFNNENGAALVIALMFMAILGVLGTTAYMMTSTDMQIGANYKTSVQAFNGTQAGIDEGRGRLRGNADPLIKITYADPVNDPTDPNWETYIGTDTLAQNLPDYATGDPITPSIHTFTDMDYAVQIMHAIDPATGQVLYWGDSDGDGISERNIITGDNIYLITTYAAAGGSNETVTEEVTLIPPSPILAALYVENTTTVDAAKTFINGDDLCGGGASLPGVASTQSGDVACAEAKTGECNNVDGTPERQYDTLPNLDIQGIVDQYSQYADITHAGGTSSSVNWGTPTNLATNPDCTPEQTHIVYVSSSLHLTAHATGCGILLVDGDLIATGGLEWYGTIYASGCISNYSGVGGNDGIAGAAFSGGNCKTRVGGSTQLNYCSTAVDDAFDNLPLRGLSWKEFN